MTDKKPETETVKVSRLGCIRKSTVEVDMAGRSVEHVEVWMDDSKAKDDRQSHDDELSPGSGDNPGNISSEIKKISTPRAYVMEIVFPGWLITGLLIGWFFPQPDNPDIWLVSQVISCAVWYGVYRLLRTS